MARTFAHLTCILQPLYLAKTKKSFFNSIIHILQIIYVTYVTYEVLMSNFLRI